MYAVKVGDTPVRVVAKEDAKKLLDVLLDLNCGRRISYKLINEGEEQAEDGSEADDLK